MRMSIAVGALLLGLALPAAAQKPPSLEIQAKAPLPKGKYAVDLDTDSALSRELRRMVMEKLAARGNQVGFSGGHVMKLQADLTQNFAGGRTPESVLTPPSGPAPQRGDGRPPLPERPIRDLAPKAPPAGETLRITLTLRTATSGAVAWVAYATCPVRDGRAEEVGRVMIDAIFANPDRSRRGEINCPL